MTSARTGIALLGLAVLLAGCGSTTQPQSQPSTPLPTVATVDAAEVTSAVTADDALGLDLLAAQSGRQAGNLAISPVSVAIALQMVATGADGTTATQLAQVLHLPSAAAAGTAGQAAISGIAADNRPGTVTLQTADTLWTQQNSALLPAFTNGLSTHFGTATHTGDFAGDPEDARQAINATVSSQTNGKIPTLFPANSIDETTRLVLTNALYLAAAWSTQFKARDTAPAPFTTATGTVTSVPTMSGQVEASSAEHPGYQRITLPYAGDRLGFSILLPAPGSSTGALLNQLRGAGLSSALAGGTTDEVQLAMPKFTVMSTMDLAGTLSALGMPTAFSQQADFDRINADHLFIQHVQHDAYVQVDENGTVAAAATGVSMGITAAPASQTVIDVNRPFLFAITDTGTGLPLFLGQVTDPR